MQIITFRFMGYRIYYNNEQYDELISTVSEEHKKLIIKFNRVHIPETKSKLNIYFNQFPHQYDVRISQISDFTYSIDVKNNNGLQLTPSYLPIIGTLECYD